MSSCIHIPHTHTHMADASFIVKEWTTRIETEKKELLRHTAQINKPDPSSNNRKHLLEIYEDEKAKCLASIRRALDDPHSEAFFHYLYAIVEKLKNIPAFDRRASPVMRECMHQAELNAICAEGMPQYSSQANPKLWLLNEHTFARGLHPDGDRLYDFLCDINRMIRACPILPGSDPYRLREVHLIRDYIWNVLTVLTQSIRSSIRDNPCSR